MKLVEYDFWQKIKNMIFAPEVALMLETKAHEEENKDDDQNQEFLLEKMCQSTYTAS